MKEKIKAYVELLDEGTQTFRPAFATLRADGLYDLDMPEDYNPEDELWAFLPGSIIALEQKKIDSGEMLLIIRHPDPDVIAIDVEGTEKSAFGYIAPMLCVSVKVYIKFCQHRITA